MIDDKDIPEEELKGDLIPEIDPAKLFDEKEYSTLIIGDDASTKKSGENADYVTILVSPKTSREEKDEALIRLKENNAVEFLINSIKRSKKPEQKATLIASCWETGLDFSKHFLFFIELVTDPDFSVSFEAFTVIQEVESVIAEAELRKALVILEKANPDSVYVTDTIELINQQLNETT